MKKTNELSEQARIAQREYQRRWRAANKDKVRSRNNRYWEKKGKELAQESEAENEPKENN